MKRRFLQVGAVLAICTGVYGVEVVDANALGFDPAAEPAANAVALQKALDGGNRKVVVAKPGTYGLDRTVFIDSHTELEFAKGVVLQKRCKYANVLVNRGAYNFGSETNASMFEITQELLAYLGRTGVVKDAPPRHNLWMDCGKATRHGVTFSNVLDGLKRCVDDYRLRRCTD